MAVRRVLVVVTALGGALLALAPFVAAAPPPGGWLPDLVVGGCFLVCGVVADARRPSSATGLLLTATGAAWFLGNLTVLGPVSLTWFGTQALWLHRGLLLHCLVGFPTGRLRTGHDRLVVALGYVAALPAFARVDAVAVGAWVLVVVLAARRLRAAAPDRRWHAVTVLRSASAVALLLAGASVARATAGPAVDATVLGAYQLLLVLVAVGVTWALVRDRSGQVADLAVELAEGATGELQDALATVLHDPGLEVAFRTPDGHGYVAADGRPFPLPTTSGGRAVTTIDEDGDVVAVVVHAAGTIDDPRLRTALAAVVRLSASNVRLRSQLRAQIHEVEASRRRLLEAGDNERRRLQRRLDTGARASLLSALERLTAADGHVRGADRARRQAERAIGELDDLARGLHPVARWAGLDYALHELVGHATVPTSLRVDVGRVPDHVATTAYFVCSEAVANATKHARARVIEVDLTHRPGRLVVTVTDDGAGGADPSGGSGLRGLADRVEGLGGTLTVGRGPSAGTRVVAELPLDDRSS